MLDTMINCDDPMYGKTGIALAFTAGSMKALNKWAPNVQEINEWVILIAGLLGLVLLLFKIRSVLVNIKMKKLEIKEKELEMKSKYGQE